MYISQNIRALRKAKKMSQDELAESLRVTKASISGYERGRNIPSVENLIRLSQIFEISIDFLIFQDLSIFDKVRLGTASPGIPLFLPDNFSITKLEGAGSGMMGYIQIPTNQEAHLLVAINVIDNQSYPQLSKGDIAICKKEPVSLMGDARLWYLMGNGIRAGFYQTIHPYGETIIIANNNSQEKIKTELITSAYRVFMKVTEEGFS